LLALGLCAFTGLTAREGRAGTLTITISWGTHTVTVTPGSALALPGSSNSNLTVNTDQLNNTELIPGGSAYTFSSLGANTVGANKSVYPVSGTLTEGGTAAITQAGNFTITIDVGISGYSAPLGTDTVTTGAHALYNSATVGDTTVASSSLNGATVGGPAPLVNTNPTVSEPTYGNSVVMTVGNGYSLDAESVITMHSGTNNFGTTIAVSGIPEPASVILMLTGMPLPLVVLGLLRRRRAAA
jgi:hypothetical protein